jgi:hypothetical protein
VGRYDNHQPQWIIRNGINDLPQNSDTDFAVANWAPANGGKNGNGALAFTVSDISSTLAISGYVEAKGTNVGYKIRLTTGGYTGTAQVYFAETVAGGAAPAWGSAYTSNFLGTFSPGADQLVDNVVFLDDTDVYVVLVKDGERSAPVKLDDPFGTLLINAHW